MVSALCARGATLRRRTPAPRAATKGVADLRRFQARDKDVSPFGPAGGRSLFHAEVRPLLNFSQQ
eukprot:14376329-Alexandrium_andersonii.AAC.1